MKRVVRLAIVVSHPIQYYVPLYRRLAARDDIDLKVFFTWHAGTRAEHDPGFRRDVAWDVPLTDGYECELVKNVARFPGSNHFWGIRTPQLVKHVLDWKPDAVHITGYAYSSHVWAMRSFYKSDIPVLFRGDSHLLDQRPGWRWWIKRRLLRLIYSWTTICLYVGKNNYDYYTGIGVPEEKLQYCPHCIDVERFAEPANALDAEAQAWRRDVQISNDATVLLYAGKFEERKRPLELVRAVLRSDDPKVVILMVGNGPLDAEAQNLARKHPERVKVLPFQNQQKMPVVYRMGDIVVLASGFGETWGLALNEAIASGRRVLASDRVGGAIDLIKSQQTGAIFQSDNWCDFHDKLCTILGSPTDSRQLRLQAREFDIAAAEGALRKVMARLHE